MKLSNSCIVSVAILLSSLHPTFALPNPRPKQPWVKQYAQEQAKKAMLKGTGVARRWTNETESPCDNAYPVIAPKENPWGGLTDVEAAGVATWLFSQTELNLTVSEEAGEWDNHILLVELMKPNKTDVLAYFDGTGPAPPRYAHVRLDNRATVDAHYADILVGPLPAQNGTTTWAPLEYPLTRKTAGKVRNLEADSDSLYTELLDKTGAEVADITQALWGEGAVADGTENATLYLWGIDPLWDEDGRIVRWVQFWGSPEDDYDAGTLLPMGLYIKFDTTGRDLSQWKLEGWFYNGIFYESTEEFRAAFESPDFERLPGGVEVESFRTKPQGTVPKYDTQYPPVMVAPSGPRYAVDAERKYVEWMDFSFYVGFTRDTGMALYDIKYKGQRVLYELGLQEALAHYAGQDPVQSGTSYLDSYYGFGPYAFELVAGYDCPSYATYLNTSFYVSETTHTHLNSLCLFEYDADYPMQRHSTTENVSIRKNVYFTIRSVSTIGNYDYAFSYTFHMDGTIGVEVRASGYIQSAFFANNEEYGWQIQDALSGSMHDHVLNYKADFDILGTNNSLMLMNQVPVTKSYPWSGGKTRNTMALERQYVQTEDESRMNWAPNGATQFIVVNQDAPNKYGSPRGYRISPSAGVVHLTVENSTNLANSANWAKHDIQVTRQHDHEIHAVHPFNSQDVNDPPIDFNKYFDGESLVQEDLVFWLNLGMHHVPHTGDLPNTVFTTAHSGIQFSPLNYFDRDEGARTTNAARIWYGGGEPAKVETYSPKVPGQCGVLDFAEPVEDLSGYKGDVVVRKFPFDPNQPFYEMTGI